MPTVSRSQANKKERVTTDISGQRCFASSRHSNLGSLLARMCRELLTSKTAWSSKLCALTWKVKDTKFKRSIFQLQPSVLHTKEKESGSLLPTPKARDYKGAEGKRVIETSTGFSKIRKGIKSEIRGESERRSTTFGHENVENSRRHIATEDQHQRNE